MLDRYIYANFEPAKNEYEAKGKLTRYWREIDKELGICPKKGSDGTYKRVEAAAKGKGEKIRLRENWGRNYGKKTKSGLRWHIPKKSELLLAAYALKMTQKDAIFLFHFCGYYLSEHSTEGLAYRECIEHIEDEQADLVMLNVFYDMADKSLLD